jgi:pre-mRNA-splicing factor ATP-dependent RNA helicase DHX38/PRP16
MQDIDILQPDPVRQGGLVQKDLVSPVLISNPIVHNICQQHKFRKPASLEPPTPRLGLDRLALEKRAASSQGDGNGKRQRLDSREPHFKGM